jgi:hypothetical protein
MDLEASLAEGYRTTHDTPRWVKMFGIVVIGLVLVFVGLHLVGGGLLGQMLDGHGGHAPRSIATEHGAQPQ